MNRNRLVVSSNQLRIICRSSLPHRNVGSGMASDGVGIPPRAIVAHYCRESGFIAPRCSTTLLPRPLFVRVYYPAIEEVWKRRRTTKGGKPFYQMASDSTYVHPRCRSHINYNQGCFVVLSSDKVKYYNRPNLTDSPRSLSTPLPPPLLPTSQNAHLPLLRHMQ